jgi:hypothetical protein
MRRAQRRFHSLAEMLADDRAQGRWWARAWRLVCAVYVLWLIVMVAFLVTALSGIGPLSIGPLRP